MSEDNETAPTPGRPLEIRSEYDRRTGRTFVELDETAAEDPELVDIARNIGAIMQGVVRNLAVGVTAGVQGLVDRGDHVAASRALTAGVESGSVGLHADPDLLDAALGIPAGALPPDEAKALRLLRTALATRVGREPDAEADARALLAASATITSEEKAGLQTFMGVAAARRGQAGAALAWWRQVDVTIASAAARAWVHRNISLTAEPGSQEAIGAAHAAADAFLEAGDKRQAATSLLHAADLIAHRDVPAATEALDRIVDVLDSPGVIGDLERAGLHHERAQRFADLQAWDRAFKAAGTAAELRRRLLGAEDGLAACLNLQAVAADKLGDTVTAAALRAEARSVTSAAQSNYFAVADQISGLMQAFDPELAAIVLAAARAESEEFGIQAELAILVSDASLTGIDRLAALEDLLEKARRQDADLRTRAIIAWALSEALSANGLNDRAAVRLREHLAEDPTSRETCDRLIDLLFASEQWGEAVLLLDSERARRGEDPRLLAQLGVANFRAGAMGPAASALLASRKVEPWSEGMAAQLTPLLEQAMEMAGGALPPLRPPEAPPPSILLADVEAAFHAFATFVAREKRGAFWDEMSAKTPKWRPSPEAFGQTLLHTFLAARFLGRVEVLEERVTGAGRLDMWLKFDRGLQIIVELKMCGAGYSANYALAGEEQLDHYMTQRSVHVGFLLVFDGRIEVDGEPILVVSPGPLTIKEIQVDLRPRVSRRGAR